MTKSALFLAALIAVSASAFSVHAGSVAPTQAQCEENPKMEGCEHYNK